MANGTDLTVSQAQPMNLPGRRSHGRFAALVTAVIVMTLALVTGVTAPAANASPSYRTAAAASSWEMSCEWGVERMAVSELSQCKGGKVTIYEVIAADYKVKRGVVDMTKTMSELGAVESFQALWARCEGNFICNLTAGAAVTYVAGKFKVLWKLVRG